MKKLIILFLLTASFIFTLTANAEVSFEITNNFPEITVTGNTGGDIPYDNVTLCVVKPGGIMESISDITSLNSNLIYYTQKNSDKNGGFIFNVDLSGGAVGRYTVYVYANGSKINNDVFYVTTEGIIPLIEEINSKTTLDELGGVIDLSSSETDTALIFNLKDELIYKVPEEKLLTVFLGLNGEGNKVNPSTPSDMTDKIILSSVIAGLNEGVAFDLLSYDSLIGLPSEYKEAYNIKLSDDIKLKFTEGFAGKSVSDKISLNSEFKNQVILSVLNNIRNRSDIEYIIEKFGTDMSINISSFVGFINKEALIDQLGLNAPYGSVEAFITKYNALYSSLMIAPPSSGGGGGGGGTSSPKEFNGVSDAPVSPENFNTSSEIFSDLDKTPWAKEYIVKLYNKGIVKGVTKNEFAPDKNIKREEFVKMLVEAFCLENVGTKAEFKDADVNGWYYDYLMKAYSAGIINGYSDGRFGVGEYITREDMITLSYRAALKKEMEFSETSEKFSDDDKISDYAKTPVYAFKKAGIVQGSGNNLVNPKNFLTRAEAAKIICMLTE